MSAHGTVDRIDYVALSRSLFSNVTWAHRVEDVSVAMKRRDHWPTGVGVSMRAQEGPPLVTRRRLPYDRSQLANPEARNSFCAAIP